MLYGKVKTLQYYKGNPNDQKLTYEQAHGDSGKKEHLFNRKRSPAEPGSGRWWEREERQRAERDEDKANYRSEQTEFNAMQ